MSQFKPPKNDAKYHWTHHVVRKMGYYGLTPSRVLRVIRAPDRIEEGIVPDTLAAMQTAGTKARPWEVWVMWREDSKKGSSKKGSSLRPQNSSNLSRLLLEPAAKVIITAWRYPGISPVRERVPIPSDIVAELQAEGVLD